MIYQTIFGLLFFIATIANGSPVPSNTETDIVGGHTTWIQNFPHQVSLRTWWGFHFCGASLIHKRWVLSAAHCTIWYRDNEVHVWVGTSFLSREGTGVQSSLVINHPAYNSATLVNDISLVRTSQNIPIDNWSSRIISMATHTTQAGANVVVSGWGFTDNNQNVPDQLQRLDKIALSNDDCRRRLSPWESFVPESKICAIAQRHQGVCQGDSGGPLIEGNLLIGVVSFGGSGGWCATGVPDGYERVSYFVPWILDNINRHTQ